MNNIRRYILTGSALLGLCISMFNINNIMVNTIQTNNVNIENQMIDFISNEALDVEIFEEELNQANNKIVERNSQEDYEITQNAEENKNIDNNILMADYIVSEKTQSETQSYKIEKLQSEISEDNNKTSKEIKVELTAYCNSPECSGEWGSQTAMGTQTQVGVIAAPKEISLGSQMYIPDLTYYKEDGIFNVEDRGSAIKIKEDGTYIIDVWFPTYEEAKQFGRQTTTAYLIE